MFHGLSREIKFSSTQKKISEKEKEQKQVYYRTHQLKQQKKVANGMSHLIFNRDDSFGNMLVRNDENKRKLKRRNHENMQLVVKLAKLRQKRREQQRELEKLKRNEARRRRVIFNKEEEKLWRKNENLVAKLSKYNKMNQEQKRKLNELRQMGVCSMNQQHTDTEELRRKLNQFRSEQQLKGKQLRVKWEAFEREIDRLQVENFHLRKNLRVAQNCESRNEMQVTRRQNKNIDLQRHMNWEGKERDIYVSNKIKRTQIEYLENTLSNESAQHEVEIRELKNDIISLQQQLSDKDHAISTLSREFDILASTPDPHIEANRPWEDRGTIWEDKYVRPKSTIQPSFDPLPSFPHLNPNGQIADHFFCIR